MVKDFNPRQLGAALIVAVFCVMNSWAGDAFEHLGFGPFLARFPLTLDEGERTEALGPLFYSEQRAAQATMALPPFFCRVINAEAGSEEHDFLYPLLTYDRFGSEYRWQLFQLLSFAGGRNQAETEARRFTLFPFYFQQRSTNSGLNYTALVPFYGNLKGRLFKDEISFAAFPIYARTRKRDVITDNYLYPFFHLRTGDGLRGWQFWPLYGTEHKEITAKTNGFGDIELLPGHDKLFAPWPFFLKHTTGIGSDNPQKQVAVLPLFSSLRSPNRDSTTVLWPLITWTDDREKKYREVDAPWPLIVFADGEGKTTRRVFPLFSHAQSPNVQSDFYLWPAYKYKRIRSGPLDRERTRILLFLYSDVEEKNTETGKQRTRNDLWPLFAHRRDNNGSTRLQILAPLEPFLPNSKSIDRNWSPVWSVWRAEDNPVAGTASRSLLWNLYRSETAPASKKNSLFFGLFQYHSDAESKRWRLFYIPLTKSKPKTDHVSEHR